MPSLSLIPYLRLSDTQNLRTIITQTLEPISPSLLDLFYIDLAAKEPPRLMTDTTGLTHAQIAALEKYQPFDKTGQPQARLSQYVPPANISNDWSSAQRSQLLEEYYRTHAAYDASGGRAVIESLLSIPEHRDAYMRGALPLQKLLQLAVLEEKMRMREGSQTSNKRQIELLKKPMQVSTIGQPLENTGPYTGKTRQQRQAELEAFRPSADAWYKETARRLAVQNNALLADHPEMPTNMRATIVEDSRRNMEDQLRSVVKNLSDEQLAAIQDPSKQKLIQAGGGSGKSAVIIASLIDHVVNQKADPRGVFIGSLTHSATNALTGLLEKAQRAGLLPGVDLSEGSKQRPRTTYSALMSYLTSRTVEQPSGKSISPLQAMDQGKYKDYSPLGVGGKNFQNIEEAVEAAKRGERTYFENLLSQHKVNVTGMNIDDTFGRINKLKLSADRSSEQFQGILKKGQQDWNANNRRSFEAQFFMYQMGLRNHPGFGLKTQSGGHYDLADTLAMVQRAGNQGLGKGFGFGIFDEFQDNPLMMIKALAAISSHKTKMLFAGDMGQKTIKSGDRVDEFVHQLMSQHNPVSEHVLTGNYRSGPWTVSMLRAIQAEPALAGRSGSPPQISMRPEMDLPPTYRVEKTFASTHRAMVQDIFAQLGLTMDIVKSNMASGQHPLAGSSMLPQQAPALFQMKDQRQIFKDQLQKHLVEHLGRVMGKSAMGQMYSDTIPNQQSEWKINALLENQARSRSFAHPFIDMTRVGSMWSEADYLEAMQTMISRTGMQSHLYQAQQNMHAAEYNQTPDTFLGQQVPRYAGAWSQRMIQNMMDVHGVSAEELAPALRDAMGIPVKSYNAGPSGEDPVAVGRFIDDFLKVQPHAQMAVGSGVGGMLSQLGATTTRKENEEDASDTTLGAGMRAMGQLNASTVSGNYKRGPDTKKVGYALDLVRNLLENGRRVASGGVIPKFDELIGKGSHSGPFGYISKGAKAAGGEIEAKDRENPIDKYGVVDPMIASQLRKLDTQGRESTWSSTKLVDGMAVHRKGVIHPMSAVPSDSEPMGSDEEHLRGQVYQMLSQAGNWQHPGILQTLVAKRDHPDLVQYATKYSSWLRGATRMGGDIGDVESIPNRLREFKQGTKLQRAHVGPMQHELMAQQARIPDLMHQVMSTTPMRDGSKQSVDHYNLRQSLMEKAASLVAYGQLFPPENGANPFQGKDSITPGLLHMLAGAAEYAADTVHADSPDNRQKMNQLAELFRLHAGRVPEYEEGVSLSEEDLAHIHKTRPEEGVLLEYILRDETTGKLRNLEHPDVKEAMAQLPFHMGNVARYTSSAKDARRLGIPFANSQFRPYQTHIQAMADWQLLDPQAVVANRPEGMNPEEIATSFRSLGAGTSLSSLQKRMQDVLDPTLMSKGRMGLTPAQEQATREHIGAISTLRGTLNSPDFQRFGGHFLNVVGRATYGQAPVDKSLTRAERKARKKAGIPSKEVIDLLFGKQRNEFAEGARTLPKMQEFVSAVSEGMAHLHSTGSIKRGHIDRILQSLDHDPNDASFTALRHLEKVAKFTGPDATLPIEGFRGLSQLFPKEREEMLGQMTRMPFSPGEHAVYMGGMSGFTAQSIAHLQHGLQTGTVGQLSAYKGDFGLQKRLSPIYRDSAYQLLTEGEKGERPEFKGRPEHISADIKQANMEPLYRFTAEDGTEHVVRHSQLAGFGSSVSYQGEEGDGTLPSLASPFSRAVTGRGILSHVTKGLGAGAIAGGAILSQLPHVGSMLHQGMSALLGHPAVMAMLAHPALPAMLAHPASILPHLALSMLPAYNRENWDSIMANEPPDIGEPPDDLHQVLSSSLKSPGLPNIAGSSPIPNISPPTPHEVMRDLAQWTTHGNIGQGVHPPSVEQLGVLNDPAQHRIIEGGPGTGKTGTLARTIAHLVAAKGILPQHVLTMSALRSAVSNLKGNVETDKKTGKVTRTGLELYRHFLPKGDKSYTLPDPITFHSLATQTVFNHDEVTGTYPLLQKMGQGYSHLTGTILTDPSEEQLKYATDAEKLSYKAGSKETYIKGMLHAQTRAQGKQDLSKYHADEIVKHIGEVKKDKTRYRDSISQGQTDLRSGILTKHAALVLYEHQRNAQGLVDFDDVPSIAADMFERLGREAVPQNFQGTRIMGIDEGQDITPETARMTKGFLGAIAQNIPHAIVNLDPMQSLTQGMGGTPTHAIRQTWRETLGMPDEHTQPSHPLSMNFRSSIGDIAMNDAILEHPALHGEPKSPMQRPGRPGQSVGQFPAFILSKSQPRQYEQTFMSMLQKSGVPLHAVVKNVKAGQHAFAGVDFSSVGHTAPSQIPHIVSRNKDLDLFQHVAKQRLVREGLSPAQAETAWSQMFRKGTPSAHATDEEREQSKSQFWGLTHRGARAWEWKYPHTDATLFQSPHSWNLVGNLHNRFVGFSRVTEGGQNVIGATSHPFSRAQTNQFMAGAPYEDYTASPTQGEVRLGGKLVPLSMENRFETFEGQLVPAQMRETLERRKKHMSRMVGSAPPPPASPAIPINRANTPRPLPPQAVQPPIPQSQSGGFPSWDDPTGSVLSSSGIAHLYATKNVSTGDTTLRQDHYDMLMKHKLAADDLMHGMEMHRDEIQKHVTALENYQPTDENENNRVKQKHREGIRQNLAKLQATYRAHQEVLGGTNPPTSGSKPPSLPSSARNAPPPLSPSASQVTLQTPDVQINVASGGNVSVSATPSSLPSLPAPGNIPLTSGGAGIPAGSSGLSSVPGSTPNAQFAHAWAPGWTAPAIPLAQHGATSMSGAPIQSAPPAQGQGGGGAGGGHATNKLSEGGRTLARIGYEMQFDAKVIDQAVTQALVQGSQYRRATMSLAGSGSDATSGFYDFNNRDTGIGAFQQNKLPMYSTVQVAQALHNMVAMTGSQNMGTAPTTNILGLSAMSGVDSNQLMAQMGYISGVSGRGAQGGAYGNMTGMLGNLYGNNLSQMNVTPTLDSLASALPSVQGLSPTTSGNAATAQIMAIFKVALKSGMTTQNLPDVASLLGNMSQLGSNPNLQQQYALQQSGYHLTSDVALAQFQQGQTGLQEQMAQLGLQQNINGQGLSLPQLNIQIDQAQISMDKAQLDMSGLQVGAAQIAQQGSQLQYQYGQAGYGFNLGVQNALLGPIGGDRSQLSGYSFQANQLVANRNTTSPETGVMFNPSKVLGLRNQEFYAGLQNQQQNLILSRSPLLSDALFQQHMKYINQQAKFYEQELAIQNAQRQFEKDWQAKLLHQQGIAVAYNKKLVDQQGYIYQLQQQQYGLEVEKIKYDEKVQAINQKFLAQQLADLEHIYNAQMQMITGQGPINGGTLQPADLIKMLASDPSFKGHDDLLIQRLRQLLPGNLGDQQTLFKLVKQVQSDPSQLAKIATDLQKSSDSQFIKDFQNAIKNGNFNDLVQQSGVNNQNLALGGTGVDWKNLTSGVNTIAEWMPKLTAAISVFSPLLLYAGTILNVLGTASVIVATGLNIIGFLKGGGIPGIGIGSGGGVPVGVGTGTAGGIGSIVAAVLPTVLIALAGAGLIYGSVKVGQGLNDRQDPNNKAAFDSQESAITAWISKYLPWLQPSDAYKKYVANGYQNQVPVLKTTQDVPVGQGAWEGRHQREIADAKTQATLRQVALLAAIAKSHEDAKTGVLQEMGELRKHTLVLSDSNKKHATSNMLEQGLSTRQQATNTLIQAQIAHQQSTNAILADSEKVWKGSADTLSKMKDDQKKYLDSLSNNDLTKLLGKMFGGSQQQGVGGGEGNVFPATSGHPGFITPNVNKEFGAAMHYGKHQGVDFAASQGTPISEFIGGEVTNTGFYPWGGEVDVNIPGTPLIERYLHLSRIGVGRGDKLKRGTPIGLTGGGTPNSGLGFWSSGSHSHVQIDAGNINSGLNPWPFWAMAGALDLTKFYGASGKPGNTPGFLAEGGIAMRPLMSHLADGGEPEAVIPLSKLSTVLSGVTQTTSLSSSSLASGPAVHIGKITDKVEVHVHTQATTLDDRAKDELMAQIFEIFGSAAEKFAGKLT